MIDNCLGKPTEERKGKDRAKEKMNKGKEKKEAEEEEEEEEVDYDKEVEKEKEDDEGQKGEAEEAGKEPLAIQDLLVKSMTDQINYRQQEDPSFVCPEKLQLWKDEKNEDSEKKMKDLWDIFIQAEKRSKSWKWSWQHA
ncbi:hypothetical protein Prudu_1487S001400 [Prunus dulcis]|uniref:Uncharacterized protein n=1 Tax=Prunus dulcis TaxID=3755 RepID=A0A5H2XVV8_PRUDU|nr:hypothetical protein Prudu_1487S001400 [Prunus dulcis]